MPDQFTQPPTTSAQWGALSPAKEVWFGGGITPDEAARKDVRIGDTVLATIGDGCEMTIESVVLKRRPDDGGLPLAHEAARWHGFTRREQIGEYEGVCAQATRLATERSWREFARADRNAALARIAWGIALILLVALLAARGL